MNNSIKHSSDTAKLHIAIAFIGSMLSMVLLPNVSLAEVYKCKDAKGKITYSDSPCQKLGVQLPVDSSIQYENSASGRQTAVANKSRADLRKAQENAQVEVDECYRATLKLVDMAGGRSSSVAFARQKMAMDAICGTNRLSNGGQGDGAAGAINNPVPNQTSSGNGVDSANRDFDVQMKAKRDYQKQQIPGFITHQPTDAHERGVYKQEMNRQKNIDPNTWNH
ncbi:MAG TPA: DUF4124 domain-containing protein [Thiobacillus sp.]|nr:DUF4124 domain-containing protein [Thiobacillus sp.]